jgi:ArsR family transcriptional regulator, lead/cadmium/zinc/bismuth-responsive transcriptional repressor
MSVSEEQLNFSQKEFEKAAKMFDAMSEEKRLRLLLLLMPGEKSVTQISEAMSEKISTISQRLKILETAELVTSRREGKYIYYSLADQHITDLILNALMHSSET